MFGNFSKMKFVDTNLSNARLRDVAFRNLTAREGRAMASGRSGRLATALDARATRASAAVGARNGRLSLRMHTYYQKSLQYDTSTGELVEKTPTYKNNGMDTLHRFMTFLIRTCPRV